MKGDFSRSSFDPKKHYTSVRMQQGRVQLDADWNEQADITLHQLRTQLEDLIGKVGIPQSKLGFVISDLENKNSHDNKSNLGFTISAGRCYVDGILCINEKERKFIDQEDYPGATQEVQNTPDKPYLVYLDVWERHITALEDPEIREVALEGIDTATRTKTVWQVKLEKIETAHIPRNNQSEQQEFFENEWRKFIEKRDVGPKLTARLAENALIQQNQLYRVEIHHRDDLQTTLKWSRENGSVAYPITKINAVSGNDKRYEIQLEQVDPEKISLEKGDWAEIADDDNARHGTSRPLFEVIEVQKDTGKVTLESKALVATLDLPKDPKATHTFLRRWDGKEQWKFTISASFVDELIAGKDDLSESFRNQFKTQGIEFTKKARIQAQTLGKEWLVNDDKIYRIQLNKTQPRLFSIELDFAPELDAAGPVSTRLQEQFQKYNKALASDAQVIVGQAGSEWTFSGVDRGFLILMENQTLNVYNQTLTVTGVWIPLENGIMVSISDSKHCKVSDYWLIPARANLNGGMGGIVWPKDKAQPPHGIEHHYAPLAAIQYVDKKWQPMEWKALRFHSVPVLTEQVDNLDWRITKTEVGIDKLTERVTTTEADINKLTERVTTTEADISKLTERVTTTEADINDLTKRVQSLEQKKWDLRRVEWLMTAIAVLLLLLLLSFTLMFFTAKEGLWFVVIILLIGGGLFWARQKLPPSKGDRASK